MNEGTINSVKEGILHSLEKRGVLDNLKAYLRTDLYNKLKKGETEEHKNHTFSNNESKLICSSSNKISKLQPNLDTTDYTHSKLNRLTVSLISDFMRKNNMHYTLSVFLPECKNLISDDPYVESELSRICEITYENLENANAKSFLNYLIKNTVNSTKQNNSISIQTEPESNSSNLSVSKLYFFVIKLSNISFLSFTIHLLFSFTYTYFDFKLLIHIL
jgi:hypothetical protein